MSAKQYPDSITFEFTSDAIYWLRSNKGIRPSGINAGFPMITIYVDNECLGFKSHKLAVECLLDVSNGVTWKAFRNFGKGLTLKALHG